MVDDKNITKLWIFTSSFTIHFVKFFEQAKDDVKDKNGAPLYIPVFFFL